MYFEKLRALFLTYFFRYFLENMICYNNLNEDQYVPNNAYPHDIKLEEDELYGYSILNTKTNFEILQNNNQNVFGTFPQTGESLSHLSETESSLIEFQPVRCVRGVRTIIKNPVAQHNGGIRKAKNKMKTSDSFIPKEKDRARLFNDAFEKLRRHIPSIPASKKLSKIEILRLAICYMAYLRFLIEFDIPAREARDRITSEVASKTEVSEHDSSER